MTLLLTLEAGKHERWTVIRQVKECIQATYGDLDRPYVIAKFLT